MMCAFILGDEGKTKLFGRRAEFFFRVGELFSLGFGPKKNIVRDSDVTLRTQVT